LFSSCGKDENKLRTQRCFYDFPDNKLWAHRVNTASWANQMFNEFNGIETDVYFIDDKNEFQTGHEWPSGNSIDLFFDSIYNCSSHYYWIDYKNLTEENASNSANEMKRLVNKFHLEGRVIVESSQPDLLAYFSCDEIFTSYWIDDINAAIPYFEEDKLANNVQKDIMRYHFDALSCSYEMNSFFQKYFKNYNVHLWTNELTGRSGIEDIRKLAQYANVRVILVDYDKNFMMGRPHSHSPH
jgi:hypothetical protein